MEDTLVNAMLFGGQVSLCAISAQQLVSEALRVHNASPTCAAALGRALMMTAILGNRLKSTSNSVTVNINGGGPLGSIVCVGRPGSVKGYVDHPSVEPPPLPNGKLNVGGAVGKKGFLTLIRDLSMKEPYVGRCRLASGEIAEDFAWYFTVSEQTNSLVYLGERLGETVRSAGGLLLQPMPDCPESTLVKLEQLTPEIATLSRRLESTDLKSAVSDIFCDLGISFIGEDKPLFKCDCSRERLERVLISLGKRELEEIIEQDGRAEITCQFCNNAYNFDKPNLQELLAEATQVSFGKGAKGKGGA